MFLLLTLLNIIFSTRTFLKGAIGKTILGYVDPSEISSEDVELCQEIFGNLALNLYETDKYKKQLQQLNIKMKNIKKEEIYMLEKKQRSLCCIDQSIKECKKRELFFMGRSIYYTPTVSMFKKGPIKPIRKGVFKYCCNSKSRSYKKKCKEFIELKSRETERFDIWHNKISEEWNECKQHKKDICSRLCLIKEKRERNITKLSQILATCKKVNVGEFEDICRSSLDYIQQRYLNN